MTLFDAGPPQPPVPEIHRSAVLSICGRYRYLLTRSWGDGDELVWLMLNPSVADDTIDDQTVTKVMGYTRRAGCTTATLINLFAYRSTDPWELLRTRDNIVGPENDRWIDEVTGLTSPQVVCAWGGWRPGVAAYRTMLDNRIADVLEIIRRNRCPRPLCLGRTKAGAPRHPSRGSYVDLVAFR